MAERKNLLITRVLPRVAFGITTDTDEGVFLPTSVCALTEFTVGDEVEAVLVANRPRLDDDGTKKRAPWFALTATILEEEE